MTKTALCAAACLALTTTSALAIEVARAVDVAAPPAKVWAAIGDFCGIGKWHPAIAKCRPAMSGPRAMRTLSLKGGGTIVEEQLARDDAATRYSYAIVESPLPVADYTSTLAVTPIPTGSRVTWTGAFKAKGAPDAKAQEVIAGIYEAGLVGIAQRAQ